MEAKFIKKPLIIKANQYVEYGKLVTGMCNSQSCFVAGNTKPHVHTIHNNQIVLLEVGDYIIPESDGIHYYPCKPDIFLATYDPLPTDTTIQDLHAEITRLKAIIQKSEDMIPGGDEIMESLRKIAQKGGVVLHTATGRLTTGIDSPIETNE